MLPLEPGPAVVRWVKPSLAQTGTKPGRRVRDKGFPSPERLEPRRGDQPPCDEPAEKPDTWPGRPPPKPSQE